MTSLDFDAVYPLPSELLDSLNTKGWVVIPGLIEEILLEEIISQLEPSLALRARIRERNGVEGNNDGTLHHLLADHPSYLRLLGALEPLDQLMRQYFRGNYILNSYGGVVNRRNTTAYVHGVHRDIRFSSDDKRFMLNVLVMLDEFTLQNGATHLLSCSQTMVQKPDDRTFLRTADRALGPRGSLLFFDSRLWHATGDNQTDQLRRALTLTFTSPFFKPQIDHPRLVGFDKAAVLSPFLKQVIGYNSRIPSTLDEYYLPVKDRFYQRGQDD